MTYQKTGLYLMTVKVVFINKVKKSNHIISNLIAMFLMTSSIVINMPTRISLAAETMTSFLPWLANLNIKRKVMSMFENKKYCC